MTLTAFKREIKNNLGKNYSLVATDTKTGKERFSVKARPLTLANTVSLRFGDSYIDYPKAKNFEGDLVSFSITNEDMDLKMIYTLQP